MARVSTPDADALAWVAARTNAESRVMAAPYVLMRLRSKPVPFWGLGEPFSPTAEALRRAPAEWLIVDAAEWRWHHAEHSAGGGGSARAGVGGMLRADACHARRHGLSRQGGGPLR